MPDYAVSSLVHLLLVCGRLRVDVDILVDALDFAWDDFVIQNARIHMGVDAVDWYRKVSWNDSFRIRVN